MPNRIQLPGATGALPNTPTALIVEDCLYSAEALRLMARACGLRSRHAATLEAAERHLAIFRPAFAIVDLGLPDGCGQSLLHRIARDSVRPGVLAISADPARLADPDLDGLADARCEKPIASARAFYDLLCGIDDLCLSVPRRLPPRPDEAVLTQEIIRIRQILNEASDHLALHRAAGRLEGLAAELGLADLRAGATRLREGLTAETAAETGDAILQLTVLARGIETACQGINHAPEPELAADPIPVTRRSVRT